MDSIDSIVQEVRGGRRERFREIFAVGQAPVRAVLAAMLPDRSVVEDLLHEVFLTAYVKLGDYQIGTDFLAWVKTLARSRALNERRRLRRQQSFNRRYATELDDRVQETLDRLAGAVDLKLVAELRDCVERLAERPRRLVQQYYFEGASGPEIARREAQKEGWVRLVLHRARASLLGCLESKGALPR